MPSAMWSSLGARRLIHSTVLLGNRGPTRHPGWYPRDHKPDSYPETDEERRASAIKYGLRPEDYMPIDKNDVERFAGDYPELGDARYAHKDPYEDWSDRLYRRNWGEPVTKSFVYMRPDRWGANSSLNDEHFKLFGAIWFCGTVTIPLLLAFYWLKNYHTDSLKWKNPIMPKQYSRDYFRAFPLDDPEMYPIVNYTFEPAEDEDSVEKPAEE